MFTQRKKQLFSLTSAPSRKQFLRENAPEVWLTTYKFFLSNHKIWRCQIHFEVDRKSLRNVGDVIMICWQNVLLRDTTETIESGPLCITDLFQNKSVVELVSKELNHLAAILHVYARGSWEVFFLCSPDCPKQPRTSFPFYEFF